MSSHYPTHDYFVLLTLSIDFFAGLITAATIFLLTQLAIIGIWTFCYQRRQKLQSYQHSY